MYETSFFKQFMLVPDHDHPSATYVSRLTFCPYGMHIQVLDVGCGEGSLLTALCNPAPWLATQEQDSTERFKILRISNLHGLDISDHDLKNAVISTSPPSESSPEYAYYSKTIRWEPLQVQVWKGSLASVNEPFIGIESIVSTEVYVHRNPVGSLPGPHTPPVAPLELS